jgi:hypothetical protein
MWLQTYRCLVEELDWYTDSARHLERSEAELFEGFEALRVGIWSFGGGSKKFVQV